MAPSALRPLAPAASDGLRRPYAMMAPMVHPGGSRLRERVGHLDDPFERRPASGLFLGINLMSGSPRLRLAVRLAELAVGTVAAVLLAGPIGVAGLVSDAVCGLAWLAWIIAGDRPRPVAGALVVLSTAAGVATAEHGFGVVFEGVAAAGAGFSFDLLVAAAIASPALVTVLLASAIHGSLPPRPWLVVVVALVALVSGGGRRQLLQHARQAKLLATAQERAAMAGRESELMAERNRLGREIHDVLAHTLSATSIQLTALDARVAAKDPHDELRGRVAAIHRLVGDGLVEARDAVRALREDSPPIVEQLRRLCDLHRAVLDVAGPPPVLGPEATLTLYRVAQEALTNVDKHAPLAPVVVRVVATGDHVRIHIENAHAGGHDSPLAASGGGQGLVGLRERVGLAGGTLEAGPTDAGWHVVAELPAT